MSSLAASGGAAGLGIFVRAVLRNRGLVTELVMRDLKGSHAAHRFGSLWIYLQPLVVVATYMLIFGLVIGTRMAVTESFPGDYTSYVLIGLVPWLIMASALGRAPSIFLSNANLVKQVVFPLEVLPVASVMACFRIFVPCILLTLLYKLLVGGGLGWLALLLPLALAAHALLALGLMLVLSVVTPFMRDIREFVTVYTSISMYFTPAIYLPDWVPEAVRPLLYCNPFSYVVWVYQDILFFGEIRHGFAWVVFAGLAAVFFLGGLTAFRRVKAHLGNVL